MSVKEKAVERAIAMLTAAGAEYHIKMDNFEWGQPLVKVKPKKKVERNGIAEYARGCIRGMEKGECRTIYLEQYSKSQLQSALAATALNMWGKGNFVTARVENAVEILRVE